MKEFVNRSLFAEVMTKNQRGSFFSAAQSLCNSMSFFLCGCINKTCQDIDIAIAILVHAGHRVCFQNAIFLLIDASVALDVAFLIK